MSKQAYKRVRRALRMECNRKPLDAYAWPGGYPIVYVFADGGCICPSCANENIREIDEAMRDARGNRPHSSGCGGWALAGADVNYEDELSCDNCGEAIPAAYVTAEDFAERAAAELSADELVLLAEQDARNTANFVASNIEARKEMLDRIGK